ncbi:MAG: sporulation histidine kinase inhibitor Sda [Bacillaceae bacterium]|nr:sporulation histidine kinase inhibitor Sda [Bacillaceae bacterium]
MRRLKDEQLLETYFVAKELGLNEDFVNLLKDEICKRNLEQKISTKEEKGENQ